MTVHSKAHQTSPQPERLEPFETLVPLAVAMWLGMSVWFSASAVASQIVGEWALNSTQTGWLTGAVQGGFALGTLVSATLNIADRVATVHLFAGSAVAAGLANAAVALVDRSFGLALLFRALTGFCLAGVYPPGMKLAASWFKRHRGFAMGVLVGALTLGAASPHLLNTLMIRSAWSWRTVILSASIMQLMAALIALRWFKEGPYVEPGARFNWRFALSAWKDRQVRLANLGYLGHMWELYAMWTWIPAMLAAAVSDVGRAFSPAITASLSFAAIGVGAIGCTIVGWFGDRIGRARAAALAMITSGACCLLVGLALQSPIVLAGLAILWGFSVVADSAQFSACVSEASDQRYIGSALTLQIFLGFTLTMVSIRLTGWTAASVGWGWAAALLAPGPLLGAVAMHRLAQLRGERNPR